MVSIFANLKQTKKILIKSRFKGTVSVISSDYSFKIVRFTTLLLKASSMIKNASTICHFLPLILFGYLINLQTTITISIIYVLIIEYSGTL